MKTWMICVCVASWMGGAAVGADSGLADKNGTVPASGGAAGSIPSEAKSIETNKAEAINKEVQSLLQEENALRGESRTLATQMQNFAAELGTNDAVLLKLHQDWRAAQDKADGLRAELQKQVEKSPHYTQLKTRRDGIDERILQIRTRLREVMKDRGLTQRQMRGVGRPGIAPMGGREPSADVKTSTPN